MSEEWKLMMARNLDRELETRGISNSERARSAYQQFRGLVFGWIHELAKEVQKMSRNPRAVLIVEDKDAITVSIGTEMIRLRAQPYPFCSRGWGKLNLMSTNRLPFREAFLWSKGENFVWIYGEAPLKGNDNGENEVYLPGTEINKETIEVVFQAAFKKYLQNQVR